MVWGLAWHPSGQILASCGQDRVIRLWQANGKTWKLTDELRSAHKRTIRSVSFSPDGNKLAAAGFDGVVSIWVRNRVEKGWTCAASLEGHENEVKSVCWSPDGRLLATCGRDKTVWIWEVNVSDDDGGQNADDDLDFECLAVLAEHTQDVKMISFHPFDSNTLVSSSYDDTIKVWRAEPDSDNDWVCRQTLTDHKSTAWAAAFSPTGHYLVSVGDDQRVIVYKRVGREYKTVELVDCAHARPITAVDVRLLLSSDIQQGFDHEDYDVEKVTDEQPLLLATTGGDRQVKFWTYEPSEKRLNKVGELGLPDRTALNDSRWNPKQPDILAVATDVGKVLVFDVCIN
jgi:WD40 repeat protein